MEARLRGNELEVHHRPLTAAEADVKISISVALLAVSLQACSEPYEEATLAENDPDASTGIPPQRTPEEEPERRISYRHPCDRTETVQVTVDGGTYRFVIPLPCDPLWKLKDRGDPPPFREK